MRARRTRAKGLRKQWKIATSRVTPLLLLLAATSAALTATTTLSTTLTTTAIDGGVEIEGDDVSVYAVGDCLRPLGIAIDATYVRHVTLDDVYLRLTGTEVRE